MNEKNMDFSAIATQYGIKCTDGITIDYGSFAHQDGQEVPMVFQHNHNDIDNVIGHCVLHSEDNGVRLYGYLNEDVSAGRTAKALLQHGDIKAVSIYANGLQKSPTDRQKVTHGNIKEVSLVLSPANPGAVIDYVAITHSDGLIDFSEEEAIITNGFNVETDSAEHTEKEDKKEDKKEETKEETKEKTNKEIYDTFNEDQKQLLFYLLKQVVDNPKIAEELKSEDTNKEIKQSDDDTEIDISQISEEEKQEILHAAEEKAKELKKIKIKEA